MVVALNGPNMAELPMQAVSVGGNLRLHVAPKASHQAAISLSHAVI
jgi:hypothetical protein